MECEDKVNRQANTKVQGSKYKMTYVHPQISPLLNLTPLYSVSLARNNNSTISAEYFNGGLSYILLASKRSERDTIRGNSIENRGYLFIYMFGRTQGIFVL